MAEYELVIEEAQREDSVSLAQLLETVTLESDFLAQDDRSSVLNGEQLASYIDSRQSVPNEICLVAKLGHEVIGVCNVTSNQDTKTSHIGDIFIAVAKPYWGNGIGQFLMGTMIDWAVNTPAIRRLELTVQARNERAVHLYQKFGFDIEGTKKRGARTKNGEFLDVYLMAKTHRLGKNMKLGRKILLMLSAILATTVVAAGIYLTTTYNYATGELSKTFRVSKVTSGNSKAIQQTKPITILLMGVDTGSKGRKETWEGNSDTMILVTVNPKTKRTTMTSLERDLLADVEGSGEAKLNSAYAEGGADLAISTIQKVLDIDIDYYALINMHGMIDLVDAVGGIEVTNHFDFPISIAENEPEFQAKVEPGTHKINGEQALVYSRMRYDDPDGDYGRQKRQREVIQKIVAKLLKMDSIGSYKKILSAVSSNVQTSINLGDSTTLRGLMGYSEALKNIKSYQLAGSDAMINGGSYQVASTEDILKVQNRIKKEVGKKGVSESKLKTSLVLNDFGTSSYVSDDFVNSTGSYELDHLRQQVVDQ